MSNDNTPYQQQMQQLKGHNMARRQECPCGSGLYPDAQHDGHNIFLCYTCEKCEKQVMSKYRSDIHERYDADEPIEEE